MSGGSRNYVYSTLRSETLGDEWSGEKGTYDVELDELINDLCDVLHDLEWWDSGDIGEEQYRETLYEFKKKWIGDANRDKRLKGYIDNQISVVRQQLYQIIGVKDE